MVPYVYKVPNGQCMELISARQARDHLAEVINKVAYAGERYALTRHGQQVAVLISIDEWRLVERILEDMEDKEDIKDADASYKRYKKEGGVSLSKAKKELGL